MKRLISSALIAFSCLFVFNSCNKKPGCNDPLADNYDETANLDNGTCTYNLAFLCKSWNVYRYEVDGADSTYFLLLEKPNLNWSFYREQTYKEVYYPAPGSQVNSNGIWTLTQSYTNLTMVDKPSDSTRTFLVNALSDTGLVISVQSAVLRKYYFKPKP